MSQVIPFKHIIFRFLLYRLQHCLFSLYLSNIIIKNKRKSRVKYNRFLLITCTSMVTCEE